jgi:regulator of RNase E activity RraA
VIVVDLGGGVPDGVFGGDIAALAAKVAGARGMVLYGSSRDLAELQELEGFPVLAMGFDPRGNTQTAVDWNVPIRVGSVTVLPGDIVVGDVEAVLFFPPQLTGKVIDYAANLAQRENYQRALIRQKRYRFRDVYPLSPELRKKFEADHKR